MDGKYWNILWALGLILFCHNSKAWNWSGVLNSKVQIDNRYGRTDQVFGEIWGNFEVFDHKKGFQGGVDFITRQGGFDFNDREGRKAFQGDIYQLYVKQTLKLINSTVKLGRFQRADSQGFYALDGVDLTYVYSPLDLSFNFYGGKPQRMEDVRSVSGDWMYGLEALWNKHGLDWGRDTSPVTLDDLSVRFGIQQFHDASTTSRAMLSAVTSGKFKTKYVEKYELSLVSTYILEESLFENLMASATLDVNADIRIRSDFEIYDPRDPFPSFREQFYSLGGDSI